MLYFSCYHWCGIVLARFLWVLPNILQINYSSLSTSTTCWNAVNGCQANEWYRDQQKDAFFVWLVFCSVRDSNYKSSAIAGTMYSQHQTSEQNLPDIIQHNDIWRKWMHWIQESALGSFHNGNGLSQNNSVNWWSIGKWHYRKVRNVT